MSYRLNNEVVLAVNLIALKLNSLQSKLPVHAGPALAGASEILKTDVLDDFPQEKVDQFQRRIMMIARIEDLDALAVIFSYVMSDLDEQPVHESVMRECSLILERFDVPSCDF